MAHVFFRILSVAVLLFIVHIKESTASFTPNITVAGDGSGSFKTIAEAIEVAPFFNTQPFTIHIKAGIYRENVLINKENIVFIGDGMDQTVITSNRSAHGGWNTTASATIAINGRGFIAKYMTFENTAGSSNEQAVAVLASSNHSAFYKCSFKGFQDTLYAKENVQFYRECEIYGTIDFIFGDASAVFQNSNIFVRRPLPSQKNVVTAQGRETLDKKTGFVMHNCSIMASTDLAPVKSSFKTYLGRPWNKYSTVIVMQSFLDDLIDPAGWLEWNDNSALDTLFYGEFQNRGIAADTKGRVHWAGLKIMHSYNEASNYTVRSFIEGDEWIPSTGIPYTADFI